ncbi:MAG TPA: hypothetical protein VN577_13530 [Terriglobales bacterium]|nr:hypothetical protein [Terriglobales bacterium]
MLTSLSPVQTACLIVLAVALVGAIVAYIRFHSRYDGHWHVSGAAREIAGKLKAEVTRDGPDLIISGAYRQLPTFLRFSNSEHAPGVTVHMRARASFGLSATPISADVPDLGRNEIRSGDSIFDQRFTIRTDQPTQARLLLSRQNLGHLQKLCCSSNTFFNISRGEIELNEMVVPASNTADHLLQHIESIRSLADAIHAIPGSENVRIPEYHRDRHIPLRIALVLGVLTAIIVVVGAARSSKILPSFAAQSQYVPDGMSPNEAVVINKLEGWRLATMEDLPPEGAGWLRSVGLEPGKVTGDFSGLGTNNDVAYLLVNDKHHFRLLLIANHAVRYDVEYPNMGAIGRIPKGVVRSTQWNGDAPEAVTDGLLVIPIPQDRSGAMAMFFGEKGITAGSPQDYQTVSVR